MLGRVRRHEHAGHQEAEPGRVAPLARRDPGAVAERQQQHQRQRAGVEDVLAASADQELARHRDRRSQRRQRRAVRAQQQAAPLETER